MVNDYERTEGAVDALAAAGERLMLDPKLLNSSLRQLAGSAAVLRASPVALAKAVKNEAELAGMHEAHLRDGAARAHFFAWLIAI